ncbi:hypothetical protein GCM10022223_42960 [Kineosporia mesophila]|uniref:Uncharacterized protein n=2 Tax=Kineosporia mesophila TaxID=566012 RepID=A0ABP6ZWI5_9ACTN
MSRVRGTVRAAILGSDILSLGNGGVEEGCSGAERAEEAGIELTIVIVLKGPHGTNSILPTHDKDRVENSSRPGAPEESVPTPGTDPQVPASMGSAAIPVHTKGAPNMFSSKPREPELKGLEGWPRAVVQLHLYPRVHGRFLCTVIVACVSLAIGAQSEAFGQILEYVFGALLERFIGNEKTSSAMSFLTGLGQ